MSLCPFEDLFTSASIAQVVNEGGWRCSVGTIMCGVIVVCRWIVRVSFMDKDIFVRCEFGSIHRCDANNVVSLFDIHGVFATISEFECRFLKVAGVAVASDQVRCCCK